MSLTILRERIRAALWFWPFVSAVVSFAAALLLLIFRPTGDELWARYAWPGGLGAATALLQSVAAAVMSATTLTFSLTVVTLQLASQQYSPRLLREFARDRVTQGVLSLLVSTFVVSVTGLQGLSPNRSLPVGLLGLVLVLAIASVLGLLGFIGHIVRGLRIETMLLGVHREAVDTLEDAYDPDRDRGASPTTPSPGSQEPVLADSSGFVLGVDVEHILRAAENDAAFVDLLVQPGDHVVSGSPLALVDRSREPDKPDELERAIVDAVAFGNERTNRDDPALGLRRLTDVAVKALSPGVNDPVTAVHALGYATDLLIRIEKVKLGAIEYRGRHGERRLRVPDRDLRYYFDLVVGPVRRYGRNEPLVLTALLRMLRDCAANARTGDQHEEIARQADTIRRSVDGAMLTEDNDVVQDMLRRVDLALAGDLVAAYRDESGATRSI